MFGMIAKINEFSVFGETLRAMGYQVDCSSRGPAMANERSPTVAARTYFLGVYRTGRSSPSPVRLQMLRPRRRRRRGRRRLSRSKATRRFWSVHGTQVVDGGRRRQFENATLIETFQPQPAGNCQICKIYVVKILEIFGHT